MNQRDMTWVFRWTVASVMSRRWRGDVDALRLASRQGA